ncbi:arginine deiminase [Spirochaetia bacterium]|nr:arginine deiminase [Spirochaetia bacterium]
MAEKIGPIHVYSEIGKLKSVLLKRPGHELENLTPAYLERLLFDDIPDMQAAQIEHDNFAEVLRKEGAEVVYLEKLFAETLATSIEVREQFVDKFLQESLSTVDGYVEKVREYLLSLSNEALTDTLMSGLRKTEFDTGKNTGLQDMLKRRYPYYLDPMPNLYFTRDPAASVGEGMTINRMAFEARRRESLFMQYVLKYHPAYANADIPVWLDRNHNHWMEGGDELIIARETIAIGISQRSSAIAVENMACSLLSRQSAIKQILAIEIPESRAFMHLDTVFTMVNYNQYTIHPDILDSAGGINIYTITADQESPLGIKIVHSNDLSDVLKKATHQQEIDLITCGGSDGIESAREQWNDGSNTLAVAPGIVVTYERNRASNNAMREHGLEVIEIVGSELGRGRGGPRCMSQPLVREDIVEGGVL